MIRDSASAQDARVEELWDVLDTRKEGRLDLSALKKGLRKMDHPLKNAEGILSDVMARVDTNRDGHIEFNEFRVFVKYTENKLHDLFKSIDHNGDGKLSKDELRDGFHKAGLAVPDSKFNRFFDEVDTDNNGVITFEEWRDFLLFIPATAPSLQAVLSYYSATVKVNPEGDVIISDDTIQGLGTTLRFLKPLFRSIIDIAFPPKPHSQMFFENPHSVMDSAEYFQQTAAQWLPPQVDPVDIVPVPKADPREWRKWENLKQELIECVPKPGYFVAGGLAGIVSRTTTAPLDRLKVYLIAQTGIPQHAVHAAKSGALIEAVRGTWRPLAQASKELWAAGGLRSLYAGNGINIVKVMPESAIKFGSYEASKRVMAKFEGHNNPNDVHTYSKFIAGGIGGMVSQFASYPLDTLKFRMQCETVKGGLQGNKLIMATAQKMWKQNGISAFYRGLPMGLFSVFPYAAIDLGTFEYLKSTITIHNAKKRGCHEEQAQPGGFVTAAIGGFSGAFGASLVYPFNFLRTRLQSQGTVMHPRTYTGIMDVARTTVRGEGVRGLFKGLTPNLLKVVPAVSITYVVYESSKKALDLR